MRTKRTMRTVRPISLALPLLLAACGTSVTVEPVLQVVNISPSGGAANVNIDTSVLVTFNSAIDEATIVGANFYLMDSVENSVPADLLWSAETMTITLEPAGDLRLSEDYTVVLTTGLASTTHGPLVAEINSTFRTSGDSPQNDKPVADAGEAAVTVTPGEMVFLEGANSYDPEGLDLTFTWNIDSLPEGSTAALNDPSDSAPSFVADLEGLYMVSLVVNDGAQDSDAAWVEVTATLEETDPGDTGSGDTGDTGTAP